MRRGELRTRNLTALYSLTFFRSLSLLPQLCREQLTVLDMIYLALADFFVSNPYL